MKRWGRFFHNLRFKQKLLLSYSIVALIPLISWSLYSYQQTNASLRVQTGIRFQEIIGNARDNLQSRVQSRLETINLMTSILAWNLHFL